MLGRPDSAQLLILHSGTQRQLHNTCWLRRNSLKAGVLTCPGRRVKSQPSSHALIFDAWKLETIYRIASLFALGVVLLVLGFFYNKYQERIRQWL